MLIKIAARNSSFPCMLLSALFFNNSEFYVICVFAKRFFENECAFTFWGVWRLFETIPGCNFRLGGHAAFHISVSIHVNLNRLKERKQNAGFWIPTKYDKTCASCIQGFFFAPSMNSMIDTQKNEFFILLAIAGERLAENKMEITP